MCIFPYMFKVPTYADIYNSTVSKFGSRWRLEATSTSQVVAANNTQATTVFSHSSLSCAWHCVFHSVATALPATHLNTA